MSKTNKAGRECPSWCERDHENSTPYTCNKSSPFVISEGGHAWTVADLPGGTVTAPEVSTYAALLGGGDIGSLDFTEREAAERAAVFIANLADHTPAAHGQIAAQLREYAAAAWPEKEAEAGLCRPRRISGRTGM